MNGIKLDLPRTLGYAGAALFVLSAWMPIIRILGFGTIDFFAGGFGDGPLFFAVAAATLYLAHIGNHRALIWPAAAAAAILALSLYHVNLLLELPERTANLMGGLMGTVLGGAASWLADKTINYSWGWFVPLAGIACLIGAAFLSAQSLSSQPVRRDKFSR